MAELTIADDPEREVATIINLDAFESLNIVAAGPERVNILRSFVDSTPFELTLLDAFTLRAAYAQFLARMGIGSEETNAENATDTVDADARTDGNTEAALAERAATEHTETPAEQPADTDMEADASPQTVTVRCFNCNGAGTIEFGDGSPSQTCNVCGGTGKREETVMT